MSSAKRRKLDRLVVKNWNVETLTKNRLVDWLAEQDDACDVAGLTECHGNGRAHADALELGDRYIAGAEATADDAAAGVAILLSPRARAAKINDGRSPCGRIVWVRLEGATHNLFIANAYIPYFNKARAPFADDTMAALNQIMQTNQERNPRDCIMLMWSGAGRQCGIGNGSHGQRDVPSRLPVPR
jgi:hypothetical protein